MIAAILAALGGIKGLLGLGTSIAGAIADAKIAAINAGTEAERIKAEERVKALEARARTHGRFESFARFAFAAPFIVYLWKLLVYDKVLSLGATDGLSGTLEYLLFVIVGYYFLHAIVGRLR